MKRIIDQAPAKINLMLDVQQRTFNGFHALETLMAPIALYDTLFIDIVDDSDIIAIESNNPQIPLDHTNILYKCGRLFQREFKIRCGFHIYLEKTIPMGSGLGGESADAASFMRVLNSAFNLNLTREQVFYYGRLLSWDVPICYYNQCVYINDLQSTFQFVDCPHQRHILLVKPDISVSTKETFIRFDENSRSDLYCKIKTQCPFPIKDINIECNLYNCFIDIFPGLSAEFKKLKVISRALKFAGVSMSGTGSCFFFLTDNLSVLEKGYCNFENKYPFVAMTNIIESKEK